MPSPEELIQALGLLPHPEGGAFRETYRSPLQVDVRGGRSLATAIYFLLRAGQRSAWHCVASDELWLYQGGDPLRLFQLSPEGEASEGLLGLEVGEGQLPQRLVPAGHWQAAQPQPGGPQGWTLVACLVAPGFDFSDFVLSDELQMQRRFPGSTLG